MENNQPKYKKLKQYITELILNNNLKAEDPLPTENELVTLFQISRHTVRKALDELEIEGWIYRKQGAGTFVTNRSSVKQVNNKNIGVVTTYINDYIFPRIIKGIDQALTENEYSFLLYNTNNKIEKERYIMENILTQNIKGLIIEPTKSALPHINLDYFQELDKMGIPYVFINSYYDEVNPSYIIQDDELGGFLATEHLIKLGHRDILCIFKSDDIQGLNRYKGYIKALRKYDIEIDEDYIIWYTTEEMKTKPKEVINNIYTGKEADLPTGIVCYNDQIAIWILDVLKNNRLKVPEDVSIVGFDDSDYALLTDVKLTSVSHPKEDMGREAALALFELIESKNRGKVLRICKAPELIVRESTSVPKNK